jgi:prepilin peptidase CpaA
MLQTVPSIAPLHAAATLLFPLSCAVLLLVAAARDLASRTIPNTVPLLLSLLGFALQMHDGTLPTGLIAAMLVFATGVLAWRIGLMGGGDVKLLAALAFCVPPAAVLSLITAIGLAGGVLGLAYLALRRVLPSRVPAMRPIARRRLPQRVLRAERWRIGRGSPLPYGIAIAAGGLLSLF